jgi:GNAT superfamily N-acetyltransferase
VIIIRKAKASDVPAIWSIRRAAIYKGCAGFYPDETLRIWTAGSPTEQFVRRIERNCHVATASEHIVGFGILDPDSGLVEAMFVDPVHMGEGVGKKILSYLEDLARDSGLNQLHLQASLNAVPFYRTCGFNGEKHSIYRSLSGATLDCIEMQKSLT